MSQRQLWWRLWIVLLLLCPLPARGQTELINGNRQVVGWINYCEDTGTANAYACAPNPSILNYRIGTRYTFRALNANTGAATLNLNSLGTRPIVKLVGGIATALVANDIRAGQVVDLIYDGTNMQMLSQVGTFPTQLAANGANCAAGQAPLGVSASGAAEGCFAVTTTIASGTIALATAAIASGTCATTQTVTATGVVTTDAITASFNADVTGIVGYTPATTGTLRVDVFPTANAVNAKVCNATGASITPGAVVLNYRVVR